MGVESQLPTILTIVFTAMIDSINPCAIGVLILLISVILGGGKSTRQMLVLGCTYVFAVFSVYLLAGLGLMATFSAIPLIVTEFLSILVAVILVGAAMIEVKDYFWYGRGYTLGIPPRVSKHLPNMAKHTTVWGAFFLGAFVSAVELPCTGAPYLAIITILSQYFDSTAFALLVLYNIVFVSPLVIILLMVAAGKQLEYIKEWKENQRARMRLAIGVLLIGLSWLLILIANGTVNLG